MKITAIRLDRMRIPLDPPFLAAWDPVPRRWFDATLVRVETDEGVTGVGSGDTMAGFGAYEELNDPAERAHALGLLLSLFPRLTPVESLMAGDATPPSLVVFRIRVERVSGVREG